MSVVSGQRPGFLFADFFLPGSDVTRVRRIHSGVFSAPWHKRA